jgi:hypothetical protein
MSKIKDRLKFEFNPITKQLDLVSEFNADRLVTHSRNVADNPMQMYDPVLGMHFDVDAQLVYDENGNVVTV